MKISKSDLVTVTKWLGDAIASGNPVSSSASLVFIGMQLGALIKSRLFWLVIMFLPLVVIDHGAFRVILTALMLVAFMTAIYSGKNLLSKWSILIVVTLSLAAFLGVFYGGYYVVIFSGPKYKFVFNDANNYGAYASGFLSCLLMYFFRKSSLARTIIVGAALGGMLTTIYLCQSRMYTALAIAAVLLFTIKAKRLPILIFAGLVLALFSNSLNQGRLMSTSLSGRDIIWLGAIQFIFSNWQSVLFFPHGDEFAKMYDSDIAIKGGHSLCENSYLATIICGGGVFFIAYLFVLGWSLQWLWRSGFPRTMLLLAATMAVWFFDDSLIYPISTYFQLFGVYCMSLHERAHHELTHQNRPISANLIRC